MPTIEFTPNLRRHITIETVGVGGSTLKDSHDQLFCEHPAVKGYIVDDRGYLREHVNVFLDGALIQE